MSASKKANSAWSVPAAFAACAAIAWTAESHAGIVIVENGSNANSVVVMRNDRMPGIVLSPGASWRSSSHPMQRSLAWQSYRRDDASTGLPLAFPDGGNWATSERQANVRSHISRSNAYRLKFYGK